MYAEVSLSRECVCVPSSPSLWSLHPTQCISSLSFSSSLLSCPLLQSIVEEGGIQRFHRQQKVLHEAGRNAQREIHEIDTTLLQDEREDQTLRENLLSLIKLPSLSTISSSEADIPFRLIQQVLRTLDDSVVKDLLVSFKASVAKYKSKAEVRSTNLLPVCSGPPYNSRTAVLSKKNRLPPPATSTHL